MQLFTIGLFELNLNGTYVLDSKGLPIPSYTNDDVMEYSRVWTGFWKQRRRGNIDDAGDNRIDPMKIRVLQRDVFPKMGLNQQYIGDGYPLCADLPKRHFLKQGAKYVLLGSSYLPELQRDVKYADERVRFVADQWGELNYMLCGSTDLNACTYPPVVTLPDNINCAGQECEVDTVRVVQVQGGIHYEYVPPPCVHHAFVENARKIKRRFDEYDSYMCADPRTSVASTACCFEGNEANVVEKYWGERVLASTAEARCTEQISAEGLRPWGLCTSSEKLSFVNCTAMSCRQRYHPFYWFAPGVPCQIRAKIDPRTNRIAVVHTSADEDPTEIRMPRFEEEDNPTFFPVKFDDDTLRLNCGADPRCSLSEDGYCICDVFVTEEQVFVSAPDSKEVVLASLSTGAFSPYIWENPYSTSEKNGVRAHNPDGRSEYSSETVFEVEDEFGITRFLKNVRSVVTIGSTENTFRNPVHFISLVEPTLRDARYETDAVLDQYLYHKNTAPFLAVRLAQRFGISNPSPRFIEIISFAFRTGSYVFQQAGLSVTFGQGSYGDLAATVAAIILDPEARSVVLDKDPVSGSLKEPLLKLTGLMRNLEFQSTAKNPFIRFGKNLQNAIGEMVYQAPSVYSFFSPEFRPIGLEAKSGIVSPEAQVLSDTNIHRMMNGLLSMIKYGLDSCYGGLGVPSITDYDDTECRWRVPGQYVNASAYPNFTSTGTTDAEIVNDLATIMTSGRLNAGLREVVTSIIAKEGDRGQKVIQAQQLIASSSEFHSTGTIHNHGETRGATTPFTNPKNADYKAIVVLMLEGGLDSYNLVVPHTCTARNNMGLTVLDQYQSERGELHLKASERSHYTIDIDGQPCETFAIHKELPVVHELFGGGDLSFFFNAGVLNVPSTSQTYENLTATRLFTHDTMQQEVQQVDPFGENYGTGVLGRLSQVLESAPYGFQAKRVALNRFAAALNVNDTSAPLPIVMSEDLPPKFNEKPLNEAFDPLQYFERLNGANYLTSNLFAEMWSRSFMQSLKVTSSLRDKLDKVNLPNACGSKRMEMLMKLMETRKDRGADRDLFVVPFGSWDHHVNLKKKLSESFEELNEGLSCYVQNMKKLGLWDKVTLLVVSEFGRTLTPNTNGGSDHGWGGHYFAIGGDLKGGKVFGEYPLDITEESPLNVGRGRIMPTLSWESIWMSLCEWVGVSTNDCQEHVLPNSNGTGTTLLSKDEVFQ